MPSRHDRGADASHLAANASPGASRVDYDRGVDLITARRWSASVSQHGRGFRRSPRQRRRRARGGDIPVVVVDRQSGRAVVDTVFVDNHAGARAALYPPLTTIAQPAAAMGRAAARLLIDRIDGSADAEPRDAVLEAHLIVRASAAPRRPSRLA
jgi:hypothetical protein